MESSNSELNRMKSNLDLFQKDFLEKVNNFVQNEITDKEDKLYKEVLNIISKAIGEPYEQDWINSIQEEGALRFQKNLPPGFNDKNKSEVRYYNGLSYHQKFGDLIIWKDILNKSLDKSYNDKVIFITNDGESKNKNDLIYKTSNMKVGPNIFLMNELNLLSQKKIIYLK